jgi:F-type H+-transporting ATPase subunit gamma
VSDTTASLRLRLNSTTELQSVVRTMKSLAASSIGQYQKSVQALADYYRTVELGLGVCLRTRDPAASGDVSERETDAGEVGAVVFGSDQGLVGQFNDLVAEYAATVLSAEHRKTRVWAVGARVHARLVDLGLAPAGVYAVPSSVEGIAPLVAQIVIETETRHAPAGATELHLFYNRTSSGAAFAPVGERLLPLDDDWRRKRAALPWPTKTLPEVMGDSTETLRALIRGYVFVSLFRASAESLASENTSRLAAMDRAEKNIKESLESLEGDFHRVRQGSIDEELFDVVSGFEALSNAKAHGAAGARSRTRDE